MSKYKDIYMMWIRIEFEQRPRLLIRFIGFGFDPLHLGSSPTVGPHFSVCLISYCAF
jgi:hypothetical protein